MATVCRNDLWTGKSFRIDCKTIESLIKQDNGYQNKDNGYMISIIELIHRINIYVIDAVHVKLL